MTNGIRAGLLLVLVPGVIAAQRGVLACPEDFLRPYFGWNSTDCGNCNIYGNYMEFLTEPTVRDIQRGGPADGKLQERDVLVAVDGMLITTSDAWRRMRDTRPGDDVRFTVRRGGNEVTTTIVAGGQCRSDVAGLGRGAVVRTLSGRAALIGAERSLRAARIGRAQTGIVGRGGLALPRGWLGLGISCNDACVATRSISTDRLAWRFSEPPRVTFVDPNGPAGRAGIEVDDVITAINNLPITDREAGILFGGATAGSDLQITVQRGSAKRTLTLHTEQIPDDAMDRARRSQIVPRSLITESWRAGRSYTVGGAVVDVDGSPRDVEYNERTKELVVRVGGVVVRVRPKDQ